MQRILFWANLALFSILLVLIALVLGGGGEPTQAAGPGRKGQGTWASGERGKSLPRTPPNGEIRLVAFPTWESKILLGEGETLNLQGWPIVLGLRFHGVKRVFPFHVQLRDPRGEPTRVRVEPVKLSLAGTRLEFRGWNPVGERFLLQGSVGGRPFHFEINGPPPSLGGARIFVRGGKGGAQYGVRLEFNAPLSLSDLRPRVGLGTMEGEPLPFSLRAPSGQGVSQVFILDLEADPKRFVDAKGVARVRLSLQGGLRVPGRKGPKSLPFSRDLVLGGPIRLAWIKGGRSGLRLHFGKPVLGVDPSWIQLEPRVPFEIETQDRGLLLRGDFQAGQVYHLRLKEGFPGSGVYRLAQAEERSFRVPDLEPNGSFLGSGTLLSGAAIPEVRIRGVNLSKVRLEIRKVLPGNALGFLRNPRGRGVDRNFLGEPRIQTFAVSARANEEFKMSLDLSSLLSRGAGTGAQGPKDRLGLYLLRLYGISRRGEESYWPATRLLQVTHLGAQVRRGVGQLVARVHRLEDASAVRGALLRALSNKNQVLAYGTSGEDGICRLEWVRGKGREPCLLELRKEGDQAFLDLERLSVELSGPEFSGVRSFLPEGRIEAFAWTDQGIVRPGRELRALFVVQDGKGRAPLGERLKLRWLRPGGRVHREEEVRVPSDGMLRVALKVPGYAESGRWAVELVKEKRWIGGTSFSVKAFVPDRIEVQSAFRGGAILGETASLEVGARWLDGGAASRLRVKARVFLRRGSHEFEYRGKNWVVGTPGARPKRLPAIPPLSGALTEAGTLRFHIPLPTPPNDPEERGGWAQMLLSAAVEIMDPSGRAVETRSQARVKAPRRLLLRREGEDLFAYLLDSKDQPLGGKLALRLERRWWRSEFRIDENGLGRTRHRLHREVLRETRLTVDRQGLRWRLPSLPTIGERGWLVLVAETQRAHSELPLTEVRRPGSELEVLVSKGRVRPGTEIPLRVKSPVAGQALLTVEDRRIRLAREISLRKGWNELNLRLPSIPGIPNLYVVASLAAPQRGRVVGPYTWTAGARVLLERKERTLEPELKLGNEVRPGALVHLRLRAKGAQRAFVALVDQGILRITGHPDPDPLAFFLGTRRLGTRGSSSNLALMEGARFPARHATGGGRGGGRYPSTGPMPGTISPWIQPVALASQLLIPRAGKAGGGFDATFRIPRDYEGRLRVFAVVAGPKASGAVARDLRVRAPLSLRLAGPRRLCPGDRCELSLVVRNQTGRAGTLHLEIQTKGGLRLLDKATLSVPMKRGEQRVFSLPVLAGPAPVPGEDASQDLGVRARLGGEESHRTLRLDVRPPLFPSRRLQGLVLERGKREIRPPRSFVPGPKVLRVRVGAHPLDRLRPAYRSLLDYPYGCSEQTASRARVLLALSSSLGSSETGGEGPRNVREKLGFALDRIKGMTRPFRGMGFWGPYPTEVLPTLHCLELALDLESQGMGEVPESWKGILDRLSSWELGNPAMQAWALYVLQKGHRPMRRALEDRLLPGLKDPLARCWAALALQGLGEEKRALNLLRDLGPGSFKEEGFYLSPIVGRSLLLRALQRLSPADPRVPALAESLTRSCLRPDGLTTFETAYALTSLAEYQREHSGKGAELGVRLRWSQGSKILQDGEEIRIPLKAGEPWPSLESKGRAYATIEWEGWERAESAGKGAELKGLSLERSLHRVGDEGEEVEDLSRGDLYEVSFRLQTNGSIENLCLTDLLPGGLEPEEKGAEVLFRPSLEGGGLGRGRKMRFHLERRDDRVLFFLPQETGEGRIELKYRLRAVTRGRFSQVPPRLEALYQPGLRLYGKAEPRIVVR